MNSSRGVSFRGCHQRRTLIVSAWVSALSDAVQCCPDTVDEGGTGDADTANGCGISAPQALESRSREEVADKGRADGCGKRHVTGRDDTLDESVANAYVSGACGVDSLGRNNKDEGTSGADVKSALVPRTALRVAGAEEMR